jgi:hypothetical protein
MRSENSVLSYLATLTVRGAIKFAVEDGPVEIGNATKVKCLSHSFTGESTIRIHSYVQMRVLHVLSVITLHDFHSHLVCCIF